MHPESIGAPDLETDVAVCGGGMAGLVASLSCLQLGADVVLFEKGPELGGSMALSGGNIWTYETMASVHEHVAGGDRTLQRLVVESFADGLDWLDRQGVELDPYEPFQGTGLQSDPAQLVSALRDGITRGSGDVRCSTELSSLAETRADGLRSLVATDVETGDPMHVVAKSVVLATGGFQGNESLVERYVAGEGARYRLRANPWSDGAGLSTATAAGAGTTDGMEGFYGHNLVAPSTDIPAESFMEATQYYGPLAVAINRAGRRFTDEAAAPGEERLARATLHEAGGRAVYLVDRKILDRTYLRPVRTVVRDARALGGNVAEAEDVEELCARLDEWGFDGGAAYRTVTAYNDAVRTGRADTLDPPRSANRIAIDAPPFVAVEVQPGITFTTGGLQVDDRMRVLDDGDEPDPIEGLYAAGVDVGGVHCGGYMGGLATALVTGRVAAVGASGRG